MTSGGHIFFFLFATIALSGTPSAFADPPEPIRLAYVEGDIAGMSSIVSEDGKSIIGFVEYRQHRRGSVLEVSRVARFEDGSSDEDRVEADVGKTLRSIRGRMIIRNAKGTPTVDVSIDVAAGRIKGFSGLGKKRETYDEAAELTPATYWGPLLAIVLKNFDENSHGDHLVFQTVVVTPKPRVLNMEFVRKQPVSLERHGSRIDARLYALSPTINFVVDPIVRMIAPTTSFYVSPGAPPALASFRGPRNYDRQMIRIE
ncbi:MAG TPA: hypothetical protein VN634_16105 [Candidatus Limnocylindrales bacterium]|nr:hypothetical protein [Candidatus Limnocylindrales bacterium]